MKPYPPINSERDILKHLSTIGRLRREDIVEDARLESRLLKGRLRTERAAPTSATLGATDQIYDVVYGTNFIYIALNTGSAVEWRAIPLSREFLSGGGTLSVNTTEVGTVGTGEDDLISYTIPAGSLANDGDSIEVTAWGTTAANANNKQIKFYVASTQIYATGSVALNDKDWVVKANIVRTGAATQDCFVYFNGDVSVVTDQSSFVQATETLANTLAIKFTGEATNDDDIIQKGMRVIKYEI